jgi:DNA-binding transcriptional LysR family regulator
MDLNLAHTFARVAEAQSFTAAARALGLPKSSVSRAVTRLEEHLGVRLVERTTRKLKLTDAGRAYYDSVSRGLAELACGVERVAELQGTPSGLVRLTAPLDSEETGIAEAILRFSELYPRIEVEVSLSNRRVDLIAEGFDLALRAGVLPDSSLVAKKIGSDPLWLFASPDYLARRGLPRRFADLARHSCVLFRPRGDTATWKLSGPGGTETVEVTGQLRTDDLTFTRRLMIGGAGIGLLPSQLAAAAVAAGQLRRVLPGYEVLGSSLHVVMPSAKHLPRRVALLRDFLVDHLKSRIT